MPRRGSDHAAHNLRAHRPRHPNPNFAHAGGLRRDAYRPRLFRDLRSPHHRHARRYRGPRHDVHDRTRQRSCRRGGPRPATSDRRLEATKTSSPTWAASGERLTVESQLRWIGPEKGAIHLATAAIVNAVWDLYAKVERKPVWKLVADMTPEQFVACIDFRYLTDALTRDEALEILRAQIATRARTRSADAPGRLSGLHHVGGMDGLSGR